MALALVLVIVLGAGLTLLVGTAPPRLPTAEPTRDPLAAQRRDRIRELASDPSPAAAAEAVRLLSGAPVADPTAWQITARLVRDHADADLAPVIADLRNAHPQRRELDNVHYRLGKQWTTRRLAAELDVEVVDGRLVGSQDGTRYDAALDRDGNLAITVHGAPADMPRDWTDRDLNLPSWRHPDLRRALARVRRHAIRVTAREGRVLFHGRASPPSAVRALRDAAVTLVQVAASRPLDRRERLAEAYRDERDPNVRRRVAEALLDGCSGVTDDALLPELVVDDDLGIRALAAISLGHAPTLIALAASRDTPLLVVSDVLSGARDLPELQQVAAAAVAAAHPMRAMDFRWLLYRLAEDPTEWTEPVLLWFLRSGAVPQQHQAVATLAQGGTRASLPDLRQLTLQLHRPLLARRATHAIEAIRARAGVEAGALSLAPSSGAQGGLSTAHAHGGLSATEE